MIQLNHNDAQDFVANAEFHLDFDYIKYVC